MQAYINHIGTAVPSTRIAQPKIAYFMARALQLEADDRKKLEILYRASGIQSRHSVIRDYEREVADYSFFPSNESLTPFPGVAERMRVYEEEAIKLSLDAIAKTIPSDYKKESITHLITVSCTGMYAPGLDIEITQKLGLRSTIHRTAINFMGCYGAFNGMKLAASICQSDPEAQVLLVATELCTIHFQNNTDQETLLANALFADGAAAALISGKKTEKCLEINGFHTDLAYDGKAEMAWQIGNHGFEMKLSAVVPEIIEKYIGQLTKKLLNNYQVNLSDIDHFAIHPGGKKILEVIERKLDISRKENEAAYQVLREYGNMSSPTVMFVLQRILGNLSSDNNEDQLLSFAFGPGLTLESMLLKFISHEKSQASV